MSKQSVTNNTQLSFEFQGLSMRRVVSDFEGGSITSDGGAVLLRQRIYGIALGYEDLNDHDELSADPGYPYKTTFDNAYLNLQKIRV